jgi:hypothetical protein
LTFQVKRPSGCSNEAVSLDQRWLGARGTNASLNGRALNSVALAKDDYSLAL